MVEVLQLPPFSRWSPVSARSPGPYAVAPSPCRELSRALPRAFEYYGGSVPVQVGQGRLFRASRSYTERRSDAFRCPFRLHNPSTRGAPDGLRTSGQDLRPLSASGTGVSVAFASFAYIKCSRLGFKQCSLHHARLALTGITPLRLGCIRPCSKHAIVPRSFRNFRPCGSEVSLAGRGSSTHLIITDTPFQRHNGALSL